MKTTRNIWWIILLIILLGSGFWFWQPRVQAAQESRSYEASGMMEAQTVHLALEIGGQVVEVLIEEGQPVNRGQPLVQLDTSIIDAQRAQASAAVQIAQANLDLLISGASEEEIWAAEGLLAQAEAGLRASQATLLALTRGTRPEKLAAANKELVRARDRYFNLNVGLTTDQLEKIRSVLTLANRNLAQIQGHQTDLKNESQSPSFVLQAAEEALYDAFTAQAAAQKAYDSALDPSRPFYLKLQSVRESLNVAESNLKMAQVRRESLLSNSQTTPEAQAAADTTEHHIEEYRSVAQAAYDAMNTGLAADTLNGAWLEIQEAEIQLEGFLTTTGIPTSVEAQLAQIDAAQAARDTAAANLTVIKNGARIEQIQTAQAQVEAAQAQVDLLNIQKKKATITAPSDGVILTRSVEVGQTALPGGSLLEVGQLEWLDLTIYLPEDQLGAAQVGQTVKVTTNAFPDRFFEGTVLRIASEAEFTPANVQSKEDRSRMVYAVTIQIENSDRSLKPGMVGDVVFP